MKTCKTCGEDKAEEEFHKRAASSDGLAAKCKTCQREYDKKRANNPKRVRSRNEYAKTDAGIASMKKARSKWAANNKGKIYQSTKSYRERFPKKYKAHGKVAYEVKIGNLSPKPCEICGDAKAVAHHDDYDKPLDVRWLCQAHHKQWHAENGGGANPF